MVAFVAPDVGFTAGTLRTRWTYEANGQVEDVTDAKGQVTHHEYGVLKRLKRVTYSGHVAPRALPSMDAIAYTYRGEGEVETCSETKTTAAGAVTEVTVHIYDALERRTRTRRYDGYEVTYGYDVKGNRTLVRDGDGVESRYAYDANDRLKTATTPVGVATYGYWEDGLLKQTSRQPALTTVPLSTVVSDSLPPQGGR